MLQRITASDFAAFIRENAGRSDDNDILATGLKAVDLFCPLPRHGVVLLQGPAWVGRVTFIKELIIRLAEAEGSVLLLLPFKAEHAASLTHALQEGPRLAARRSGPLRLTWFLLDEADDPSLVREMKEIGARLYLSPLISSRNLYPALDLLHSTSKLLRAESVGGPHLAVAEQALEVLRHGRKLQADSQFLELLALGLHKQAREHYWRHAHARGATGSADRLSTLRAELLDHWLTQPCRCMEKETGRPGVSVSIPQMINDCKEIIGGAADDLSPMTVFLSNTLHEARARSKALVEQLEIEMQLQALCW